MDALAGADETAPHYSLDLRTPWRVSLKPSTVVVQVPSGQGQLGIAWTANRGEHIAWLFLPVRPSACSAATRCGGRHATCRGFESVENFYTHRASVGLYPAIDFNFSFFKYAKPLIFKNI